VGVGRDIELVTAPHNELEGMSEGVGVVRLLPMAMPANLLIDRICIGRISVTTPVISTARFKWWANAVQSSLQYHPFNGWGRSADYPPQALQKELIINHFFQFLRHSYGFFQHGTFVLSPTGGNEESAQVS